MLQSLCCSQNHEPTERAARWNHVFVCLCLQAWETRQSPRGQAGLCVVRGDQQTPQHHQQTPPSPVDTRQTRLECCWHHVTCFNSSVLRVMTKPVMMIKVLIILHHSCELCTQACCTSFHVTSVWPGGEERGGLWPQFLDTFSKNFEMFSFFFL